MNDDDHLDDEALSAALDGELDGELAGAARAHLAACNRCSARQAELHAVALALGGEPAAPSAARRDAAVATVLRTTRRAPRFSPPMLVAAAAAAAVVAVAVAVPLLTRSTSRPKTTTAAGRLRAAGPVTVPDLGAIDTEGALHDLLLARLATPARSASAAARGVAPGAAPAQPPPGSAVSPSPGGAVSPSPSGEAKVTDSSVTVCQADLLRQLHRSDAPGYEAVLVWRGTPAVVFAFTSRRTEVYVMARAGCRILVFERFST